MTAADWFLVALIICAVLGALAVAGLPFVYRKGMREIEQAMTQVFADHDHDKAVSNVRVLKQYDRHAKFEAARRRSMKRHPTGGAS